MFVFLDVVKLEKIVVFGVCFLGFEVVEVFKLVVERVCLGVVLCVDILVYVVCDSVF